MGKNVVLIITAGILFAITSSAKADTTTTAWNIHNASSSTVEVYVATKDNMMIVLTLIKPGEKISATHNDTAWFAKKTWHEYMIQVSPGYKPGTIGKLWNKSLNLNTVLSYVLDCQGGSDTSKVTITTKAQFYQCLNEVTIND